MSDTLQMSKKERDRLHILRSIEKKKMTITEGAEELALSERQLYRILNRYREEGDAGLIRRLRGHPSNNGYKKAIVRTILDLYKKRYLDYAPLLFTEKVADDLHLNLDQETVRRWSIAEGLWID